MPLGGRKPLEGAGSEDRLRALAAKVRENTRGQRRGAEVLWVVAVFIAVAVIGALLLWPTETGEPILSPRQFAPSQPEELATRPGELVYYRNCAAARAAGTAPIYKGQPGYRAQLDADDDGVACEPYYGR